MSVLGDLEKAVMDTFWGHDSLSLTVREVLVELVPKRQVAYTTVMTVMERLAKKGLLSRKRQGRAWSYSAAITRTEFYAEEIGQILSAVSMPEQMRIISALHKQFRADAELTKLVRAVD